MDKIMLMDIVVLAALLFGAIAKGVKGLYKCLMPLVVVLAAIIGALILARTLTPVVTEAVYPKVEDKVVEKMQENREELKEELLLSGEVDVLGGKVKELLPAPLLKLGEKFGQLDESLSAFAEKIGESAAELLTQEQKDKLQGIGEEVRQESQSAAEETRLAVYAAAFDAAYRVTETAVRWTLRILGFVLLYFLFTLLKNALHVTVELPVIGWVDRLGGAALGILECGAILLVVGVLLKFFNIMLLQKLSEGTRVASFFFS